MFYVYLNTVIKTFMLDLFVLSEGCCLHLSGLWDSNSQCGGDTDSAFLFTRISKDLVTPTHKHTLVSHLCRKWNETCDSPPFYHRDMAERNIPAKMNHLCCQICRNLLRNPVMIPCGHNFCMRCIQDQWDCDQLRNSLCRCPECKYEFPSRPQLIKNTTLAEVVRETEMSCNKEQQSSEGNRKVLKRPRSCAETSESTLCGKHNKPLEVYCCTDKQIICAQCASAEHGGHRIGLVKEERRRKEVLTVFSECPLLIRDYQ